MMFATALFIDSKISECSSPQSNFLTGTFTLFSFFFLFSSRNRGLNFFVKLAAWGINMAK